MSSASSQALVKVATCNLNQWAMDFKGNLERIQASIREAKAKGCTFRTGPELEVTGYGCEDFFHEQDTFMHAWDSLATILKSDLTDDILTDIGMPVMHRNVAYNCRVICLNRKILGIRPKFYLANDGNYREMRYFTPWYLEPDVPGFGKLQALTLPAHIKDVTGQAQVPIGIFAIEAADTAVGFETCEELFTPNAPNILFSLDGVEIIANGSGSHHQLRKLDYRIDLCKGATSKAGGVYLYANQKGCVPSRVRALVLSAVSRACAARTEIVDALSAASIPHECAHVSRAHQLHAPCVRALPGPARARLTQPHASTGARRDVRAGVA